MAVRRLLALLVVLLLLCGCGIQQEVIAPVQPTDPSETYSAAPKAKLPLPEARLLMEIPPEPVSLVLQPEASGVAVAENEEAIIDYSNTDDGYIMVRYRMPTESRLKVLIKGPTTTYSYNLPAEEWTTFPLSDGNGRYRMGVYINVRDSKYASVLFAEFDAEMTDEFAPFLRPNQYVNYADAPNTVQLGAELTLGLDHPLKKVAAVYDHVVHNFSYDYEKAETVKSGYLPELDAVLEEGKGICFDYAALMTAMLRSQQVPCKLVVGYAGEVYHAWISVWTEENGWIDGAIFFDGHQWKRLDPTFASSGEGDPEIMEFILNGTYKAKYLY